MGAYRDADERGARDTNPSWAKLANEARRTNSGVGVDVQGVSDLSDYESTYGHPTSHPHGVTSRSALAATARRSWFTPKGSHPRRDRHHERVLCHRSWMRSWGRRRWCSAGVRAAALYSACASVSRRGRLTRLNLSE